MRIREWWLAVLTVFALAVSQLASADQSGGMKLWTAKNYAAAFRELLPLAETGDAVAQFLVARMFAEGLHVTRDPEVAARWWRRAAEQGYGAAQLRLAVMYARDEGVSPDPRQAFHWASLAAMNELSPHDAAVKLRDATATRLPADVRRDIEARIAEWSPRRAPMPPFTGTAEALKKRGSGFFVDDRGHLLTNYHVIDHCGVLRGATGAGVVTLTLVAADSARDLALLRTRLDGAEPISLSRRSQVDLGAPVVIVGFPIQGAQAVVINGIVNARVGAQGQKGLVQVSAPIQSGHSGGPALDESGQVLGIATLHAGATTTGQGGIVVGLSVISAFLAEHGVSPARADPGPALSTREITSRALRAAVAIECWR